MGLASSALYRYYPSRDALLTQLIIDAYNELGEAAEQAEAHVARPDRGGRYRAIARTVRTWAVANPHEFALIYGSPVPGYAAPEDTIDPAMRVSRLLVELIDGVDPVPARIDTPVPTSLAAQLSGINATMSTDVDHAVLAVGVGLWAQLFGLVSFELFGTFNNVFDDADAIFEFHVDRAVRSLRLADLESDYSNPA